MEEAQATLETLEQEIDTLSAERVGKGNDPKSKTDDHRWAVLLKKQLILELSGGLLETLKAELAVNRETALPISMITRVINLHKLMQQSALESKQRAMIHGEADGEDQTEENEEEKDDLADENYEPPSEEEDPDNGASAVPRNGEARAGDQDGKEMNDSGSPDELA